MPAEGVQALTGNGDSGVNEAGGPTQVTMISIDLLAPHPRNPRTLRTNTPAFENLMRSIKANGVLEPLTVRALPSGPLSAGNPEIREVLSGHRRLAAAKAAGRKKVPIFDRGQMSDQLAYDIVACGNEREPLTALEEGRRVANWLDVYNQDVKAVAGKVGHPERWVVEHAQIARGLSADWHQAAAGIEYFDRWTSSHWAVIAKLPVRIQASELAKFRNGAYCSYDRWTVKELESRVKIETFELAKAPFDTAAVCEGCQSRTGVQPLLWSDTVEQTTGAKERCLDRKCWENNVSRAERQKVRDLAAKLGVEKPVPISTLVDPQDWMKREDYRKKLSAARRVHKGCLEEGQYKIVTEKTIGAVPAVIVAGRGKNSIKWVKIAEQKAGTNCARSYEPSAKELAQKIEQERWNTVCKLAFGEIAGSQCPSADVLLFMTLLMPLDVYGKDYDKILRESATHWAGGPDHFRDWIRDVIWQEHTRENDRPGIDAVDRPYLEALAPMFNLDLQKIYQRVVAVETAAEPPAKAKDGRPEKADSPASPSPRASCDGDPVTCDVGCKPCLAKKQDATSVHEVAPSGSILDPEIIQIDLPQAYKAKVEISLGCVKGQWYFGISAHVPGAGLPYPCTVNQTACESRAQALQAAAAKITAWLDGKPGRGSYKHYGDIAAKLGEIAGTSIGQMPPKGSEQADPTKSVLRVDFPSTYRASMEIHTEIAGGQWQGGYEGTFGAQGITVTKQLAAEHCITRGQCLREILLVIVVDTRNAGVPQKTAVRITRRIEEAVEEEIARTETDKTPRKLTVLMGDLDARCTILCQRFSGKWHGGFTIGVMKFSGEKPISQDSPPLASKAGCLQRMVVSICQWLDSNRTKICNQDLRTKVFERICATIKDELDRPTCRVCGCTETNCEQCLERTGSPCTWVSDDLCSACAASEDRKL